MADLSHMRSHYAAASHETHSDAKGWFLNTHSWGTHLYRATTAGVTGLADPANVALLGLNTDTTNMVTSGDDIEVEDMLAAKVIGRLIDDAQDEFQTAHDEVEALRLAGGT
jgi:hypothetical protein